MISLGSENNNKGSVTNVKDFGDFGSSKNPACSLISNGTGSLDLSGKVILKAQLHEDIRRVPIHNEDMTYDELLLMMQRVFKGQLKPDDDILIKYKDEDGDMVTISDSSDLSFAIQCCRVLKVRIYFKKEEELKDKILKDLPIRLVRSELRELRDKVNRMLDLLDNEEDKKDYADPKASGPPTSEKEKTKDGENVDGKGKKVESSVPSGAIPSAPAVSTKEFDPFQPPPPATLPAVQMMHAQAVQAPVTKQPSAASPAFNASAGHNLPQGQHQTVQSQLPPAPPQFRQMPSGSAATHPPSQNEVANVHQQHSAQAPPQTMQQHQHPIPSAMQQQQLNYPQHQQQQLPPNYPQQQASSGPQQSQTNVHPTQAQTNLSQAGGYPTSSTPSSMSGYPYMPYGIPSQGQGQGQGQFNTSAPYTAQPRPTVPSPAGPSMGGQTTGQPQQQFQQVSFAPGGHAGTAVAPPQQYQAPVSQFQAVPQGYPPPPAGPAGPQNPFARPPTPHYKSQ